MASNYTLIKAKNAKKDEFYTQLEDIEKELNHYLQYFRGKTVLCNCDDPFESNFFQYFTLNFNRLGLKKLIATSYVTSPVQCSQLRIEDGGQLGFATDDKLGLALTDKRPYKAVITSVHDVTGNGGVEMMNIANLFKSDENELTELEGNGDFRSAECIELLKESDIVCTNPPFSLLNEYILQLCKYNKQFLVIGTINVMNYKDIFPLIMNNKLWLGYNYGDMVFTVPDNYEPHDTRYWEDENGQKWRSLGNIYWYTNLPVKEKNEKLALTKSYYKNKSNYPNYDNYDAINVKYVSDIPYDYDGVMGVPITFLQHYNSAQFELVGEAVHGSDNKYDLFKPYINGKELFKRILIKNKHS